MNKKGFSSLLLLFFVTILIIIFSVYLYKMQSVSQDKIPQSNTNTQPDTASAPEEPQTSVPTPSKLIKSGQRSIVSEGVELLSITNKVIFDFFVNDSQMCNDINIKDDLDRLFCTDTKIFENMTVFKSLHPSKDGSATVFVVETSRLEPDTVVGIFYPNKTTDNVYMLTDFYLGNYFIGYAPGENSFALQTNCWEARCGIIVFDTKTLEEKASINNPDFEDTRKYSAEFTRWVSHNEIEYTLADEVKTTAF